MGNIHEGHRKRLKDKYLKVGLDSFDDHQILELLLFYCIPRKDTNEIAHKLIDKFGSLSSVFEANPYEISKVEGIGMSSAILISMVSQLSRRYLHDKARQKAKLNTVEAACSYVKELFVGRTNEVFYIICLDTQLNVIHSSLIFEGTVKEAVVYPRKVVQEVLLHNASGVIIAHNHPSGSLKPSAEDINTTQKIVNALHYVSVRVHDHIVVGNGETFSFAQNGILPMPKE